MSLFDENWKTYTFTDKIYTILKKTHLLRPIQFVNRDVLKRGAAREQAQLSWTILEQKTSESINRFAHIIPSNKKKIVLSGHYLDSDKGKNTYFNYIAQQLPEAELLLMSNAIRTPNIVSDKMLNFNYFVLPFTIFKGGYPGDEDLEIPQEVIDCINSKEYLQIAAERTRLRHKNMGKNYPEAIVYCLYRYFTAFLEHFNPAIVVIWCEFFTGHSFLKEICDERNIEVVFAEFGSLPGTFALEKNGQMGESDVTICSEEFKKLPVSAEEIESTDTITQFIKETKLNRNQQVHSGMTRQIMMKCIPNRPVIVYFGQNDYEAGITPYTDRSKKFHSPTFESSDRAANYLAELAVKNNWNFIYKPHPKMIMYGDCLEEHCLESVIWVETGDIYELMDMADVCVTILSQCGYISLIKEKPTVMLGYTQLKGKDCTYEAFELDIIEETLVRALHNGYTEAQKSAFQKHATQMLKYNLFDDPLEKPYEIGQPIDNAVQFFRDELNKCECITSKVERNLLFYCRNEFELVAATNIRQNIEEPNNTDIMIAGEISDNYLQKYVSLGLFNNIFAYRYDDTFIEKMQNKKYTDVYIGHYDDLEIISLLSYLTKDDVQLKTHIYDGGDLKFCLKNIITDFNQSDISHILDTICEISLYDREFLVWKKNITIPLTCMPPFSPIFTADKERIQAKYLFIENSLSEEECLSNELDIVIELVGLLGKENFLIFSANNQQYFKEYGLTVCEHSFAEMIESLPRDYNESLLIFSTGIENVYWYHSLLKNMRYIDLNDFFVTNSKLSNSNSLKQLYKKLGQKNNHNYYKPQSFKEMSNFLQIGKSPLITFILPTYNSEEWIGDYLHALITSELQDIEIIILDRNSTDNTYEIIQKYQYEFPENIFVKEVDDSTISHQIRSAGIECANGTYIAFINTKIPFNYAEIESLNTTVLENKYDIICCSQCDLKDNINTGLEAKLIRTELFKKIQATDDENEYILTDDFTYLCALILTATKIGYTSTRFFYDRIMYENNMCIPNDSPISGMLHFFESYATSSKISGDRNEFSKMPIVRYICEQFELK